MKANGAITIINCLTANGTEIGVGQAIVVDGSLHRCFRVGFTVYYQANKCLDGSPACNSGISPLPAGPTNVAPFFRPARPFPAFSAPNAGSGPEYPLRFGSNNNRSTPTAHSTLPTAHVRPLLDSLDSGRSKVGVRRDVNMTAVPTTLSQASPKVSSANYLLL